MGAPAGLCRCTCPCGDFVIEIVGPWIAWELAAQRVKTHAETCPRADERWTHTVHPEPAEGTKA